IQGLVEVFLETLLGLMDTVFGDRRKSEKYLPLIATIFLFVLFSNWLGLVPGVGSIVFHGEETSPLLRSPSADLNFTLGLAIIAVISANIFGIAAIGFWRHLAKFFNFKSPIGFFIGLIELVSEVAKMISFSFRLFGNIFAGEVLLIIVAFLVPYIVPLPFLFLEVFVGFVQALIFSMLTIVFIAIATTSHAAEHN
ncbi:MAG: F0F1 ATP synthase subunit A, partial [Patescibacteria group bacterium]